MAAFLDADEFIVAFQKELLIDDDLEVTLDSRLVEDLGFDSLQMLLTIDFLSELIGDGPAGDDIEAIAALDTVRSAHNYYLTQRSTPLEDAQGTEHGLVGNFVVLKAPQASHYAQLYEIALANDVAWRWRYSGAMPTYDDFLRTFSAGVLTQLVVCRRREQQAVGLVAAHNASLANRTVSLAAVIAPNLIGTGAGVDAVILFVRYLFRTWDFEKVYMEVPEYNVTQFVSGLNREFMLEGQLRRHLYHAGRRWDQFIYAIYRSTFVPRWGGVD